MQRPLFNTCLLIIIIISLIYFFSGRNPAREIYGGEEIFISGQVYDKSQNSVYLKSISILKEQSTQNYQIIKKIKGKLILKNFDENQVKIGQTIYVKATFRYFAHAENEGEFDLNSFYNSQGIKGQLLEGQLIDCSEKYSYLLDGLRQIREHYKRRLFNIFPQKEASILSAMLLGDKTDLDSDIKKLYKNTGIIHILSISGLHISLIGMGIYELLRKMGFGIKTSAAVGTVFLILYGIMTGMSISAVRAITMYGLKMLGACIGRTYDLQTATAVAATLLLVSNPGYLEYAGFLLSVTSILGVGLIHPTLPKSDNKIINAFQGGLAIMLGTLPVQLIFYYKLPLYSIFINLLVMVPVTVLVVTAFIAMIFPGFGIVGTISYFILEFYEKICLLAGDLPLGRLCSGKPAIWQILVYIFTLCAVLWAKRFWKKQWGYALLLAAGIFFAGNVQTFFSGPCERVDFLSVGQGDCIIIQNSLGHCYIFDCGSSSRSKVGENVLIPYLNYNGITQVDGIFISHMDSDHCNGIYELLTLAGEEYIKINRVYLPAIRQEERLDEFAELYEIVDQTSVFYLSEGDVIEKNDLRILCLNPEAEMSANDRNAYSLCFYVKAGSVTLLLTGDVEDKGEENLIEELEKYKISRVDLLKVAHHGSRYSTGNDFLTQLSPKLAVISVVRNSTYGHPHEETLLRLKKAGAQILRTDQTGQISVDVRKGQISFFKAYEGEE